MKQKVLLTGASGSMGGAAFQQLLERRSDYDIVLLLRPSRKNKRLFRRYEGGAPLPVGQKGVSERDGVKIVWGDLTCYDDVRQAVWGVDHVLHAAALIPPAADHQPRLTIRTNVGGIENLIAAIKKQPGGAERIRLVSISSVATYGDRLPPIHLIRTGDPLIPSAYDVYGVSKIRAERLVIESGLSHWASIRQTYIAIPDALSLMAPIMYHQPLRTCLELITPQDAGYGLVACLDCPDDFWGRVYNMSGGPSCRFVFADYLEAMMELLQMGEYRRLMDRDWFCLRNFHCAWFEDSHVLNRYLGHQRQSLEDHYQQVRDAAPWYVGLGRHVPKPLIKHTLMRWLANRKDGPAHWVKAGNDRRVGAFYGGYGEHAAIGGWEAAISGDPGEARRLEHGYDETKPAGELGIEDLRDAAAFRGGECLSERLVDGRAKKLRWRCSEGHDFWASPTLVLQAGHFCPTCLAPPWDYDRLAKKSPFVAQAYYTTHGEHEAACYDRKCYEDIL